MCNSGCTHRISSVLSQSLCHQLPCTAHIMRIFACICTSTWLVDLLFHCTLLFGVFELQSGVLRILHRCLVCELPQHGARGGLW